MNIQTIFDINNIITNRKDVVISLYPYFLHVIDCKIFRKLPKYNGYGFISESFALN